MEPDNAQKPEAVLGGVAYTVCNMEKRTVEHDHYIGKWIRRTGVDKVLPTENETDAEYLVRVHNTVFDSGHGPRLLAGILAPKGYPWSPDRAEKTAKHIAQCNTQEDRELVNMLCIRLVFDFFARGLNSWKIFHGSLEPELPSAGEVKVESVRQSMTH